MCSFHGNNPWIKLRIAISCFQAWWNYSAEKKLTPTIKSSHKQIQKCQRTHLQQTFRQVNISGILYGLANNLLILWQKFKEVGSIILFPYLFYSLILAKIKSVPLFIRKNVFQDGHFEQGMMLKLSYMFNFAKFEFIRNIQPVKC